MALFQDIEKENIQPQSTSEIGKYFENEFQQLQSERQKRYDEVKAEQDIWINNLISPDRIEEWKNQGQMSALEVWNRKNKNELVPYMATWKQGTKSLKLKDISDKIAKGQAVSAQERKQLEDFVLDMAEMQTRGYTIGGGAMNLALDTLPFVAEFGIGLLTTGGTASLGAAGAKVAQKGVAKAIEGATKKAVEQGIGKTIAKGVGKVAYDATINPRTLAFSVTRLPQQIRARYGDVMLSDSVMVSEDGQVILQESQEKPATAFLKALGLTNIEVASEMAGATLFEPVKKKLAGVIAPKILEKLPSKFAEKLTKTAEEITGLPFFKAVESLGFNGIIEEMGEERVGDILKFAFDLDNQEGYSFEQLLDAVFATPKELAQEALAFGAFGVGANIAHQGLKKVSKKYDKDDFLIDAGIFRVGGKDSKIDAKVRDELTKEGKTEEEIETVLDGATSADKVQYLKNKGIENIEVDAFDAIDQIEEQVKNTYLASNKNLDEDTINKVARVTSVLASSLARKQNKNIDEIHDILPMVEQVNQYMYADESGKGYTQDEINEVLEIATNELYNLPDDFSDEAYVNNLSEDIRILQDMVYGKLDEADSARAWDILNRNVQRKDLGLLQQPDLQSKSTIELRTNKNKYLTDNEVEQVKIDSENFKNRINDFLNKKISPKSRITVLSALPSAYNQIPDLKGKKVIINQSIYSKIIDLPNKHKKNHNIDRKRALKLPELLADPLYILQSSSKGNEHRYVVVTSSKNNKPQERLSIILNPSNNVAIVSAYDEAININEEKKEKRVLYDKKKELSKTFATSKDAMMDSPNRSITNFQTDFKGDVKQHEGKNRLYQPANASVQDEKNLIMTHSAKIENLDDILSNETLIAPSMAITNKNQDVLNNFGFGELIFIRKPDRIDFKNDNIYDRDIYSPRMPRPSYKTKRHGTVSTYDYDDMKRQAERNPERFEEVYGESFEEYFEGAEKVLFLGYSPSGNRRYAKYNAENIIKAMKKEGVVGGEYWGYGLNSFLAQLAKKQKNLKQLKKSSVELGKVELEVIEKLKKEYSDYENELRSYAKADYKSFTYFNDIYPDVLKAIYNNNNYEINEYLDVEKIKAEAPELINNVKEFINTAIGTNRTYFEAKPMREIPIDEFSDVLVRENSISDEQKRKLERYGIAVTEYKDSNEISDVINKIGQKKPQIYFQEVEPEQQNIFPGNRAAKKIHKVKGGYLPAEKFIELFQNADASTIVHECAHWYLDELTRVAKYNEEVAEDLEAVRRFLKNEGEDFTRLQHEKFARSFEAYILTGSSRNNKIKKVFEDFKNWLLQIYDEIKNLQISIKEMPEITNLFDRLLTSEKQRSAAVFNKLSAIDEQIANIVEKQEQELDELDEIYSTNIQENNRKSDTKRKVEEYLELASKAAKREPKEVREFRERYKDVTLQILEAATGYDRRFISQARNADKVEEAINNVEDKITISGGLRPEWQEFYADTGVNYDTDEVGGDYELASQAWQVFQDGTYKIDDSEYSDIEDFASQFDYLYGKALSLQGEERYVAMQALYSLWGNNMPALPDEYLQDLMKKMQELEESIEDAEREAFNRKNFANIPVVEHLQWFITDKIKNLKIYNPETRYRMRLDKSHRLYRFIKGATSINKAKVIVRKINEFVIEDLRNQQRAIIHKEIQKQVRINSKILKTGNTAKGKFDWKTNTVFAELQQLNKMTKDEALKEYERLAKLGELENTQMREGWDEKETKFDEFKNEFDFNLKRNFVEYKSQTGRLNENAKGQRVSTLNIQLGTKILEDIIKLKEIGREAKSEEELKKKLNKRNYRNNFVQLIREKGQKAWVRKFVTHLLHSGQSLANWETTLNAVFGSEVSQELSLLEDEAAIDSYKRRIANKLFNRIRKIYNMGKANAFEMALDYDNTQQIIDLFQSFEKEKYTILETSFDINTGEFFKTNVELTKNQIITLYGWYQNDNLRRRLETQYGAGELLTLFDIALGDKEKDLVWAVIDTLQEMYPDVNEVFINETGLSLPQEQNYIPSVAERIVSDLDMLHDCIMASKSPSATKRRKTSNRIKMNPSSLMEIVLPHIDKMSRYVILQEKLNFYRAIFNNANITAAFRETYGKKDGEALHREIKNQLEEFSFGSTNRRMGKLKEFADGVAKNFIVGSIGGSPKVALGQLSSMINYSEKMPIVEWSAGMTKSLANPVKTFNYMMEHSEYLQSRLAGNTQNEIIATLTNEADKFRKVTNFFTLNVKWGDIIAVTLGGKPYVDYLVSQGMSLEEAIKKFEAETMRAQQASTASSTSRWQKKQTETALGRMFWAFRTVEFQFERKVYDALLMASRGEITPSQAIKTIMIYRVINPVIFSVLLQQFAIAPLLRMLFGDDDDPAETWKGLGISGALAILTANLSHWGYFGIGASFIIQSALKYLSKDKKMKAFKTQVPFISDVEDVTTKLFKKDGPDMSDYIDAMAVGVKYGFGVPADKLVNFGEGIQDITQGRTGIGLLRVGGWGEYAATEAITGEAPKKKKKRKHTRKEK